MNPRPVSSRVLKPAVYAVMAVFVLISLTAFFTTRASQAETERLVQTMWANDVVVDVIARDLDRKQLLIDRHIFEKEGASMRDLEVRIAALDEEVRRRLDAPLRPDRAEPELEKTLNEIRLELDEIDQPLAEVLAASRANDDSAAHARMTALLPRFTHLQEQTSRLVQISMSAATADSAIIVAEQQSAETLLIVLSLVGVILTAVILVWAMRDVRRKNEEIWEMTTRLAEQNRELDAFAGRVAHDLRGPLTTISLAAGRLEEVTPQERSTSTILRRGVARMEQLIRDLLTLSRVDSQPANAAADPADVAAMVADDLGKPVAEAGGTLEVAVDPGSVHCSDGLLRDVLANLVENAVKYRREDPPAIKVEGHRVGAEYQLRVRDNGMGMSPEEARHAFDAFYRGLRAPREVPGTGLGLSIVKRIVDVCGGRISVESKLDQGTTFIVELPLAAAAPHP